MVGRVARPLVALALTALALTALVAGGVTIAEAREARGRADAARRRGKVVRIERVAAASRRPQVCQIYGQAQGYCYGASVEVGQVGTVVDETGRKADVRIREALPQQDPCGNVLNWNISLEVTAGDLNGLGAQGFLLIDIPAGPSMRSMPYGAAPVPSGQANENLWVAFDDGADGLADVIVTYHQCDAGGAISTASNGSFCMNYYAYRGGSYDRTRQDNVQTCR